MLQCYYADPQKIDYDSFACNSTGICRAVDTLRTNPKIHVGSGSPHSLQKTLFLCQYLVMFVIQLCHGCCQVRYPACHNRFDLKIKSPLPMGDEPLPPSAVT